MYYSENRLNSRLLESRCVRERIRAVGDESLLTVAQLLDKYEENL